MKSDIVSRSVQNGCSKIEMAGRESATPRLLDVEGSGALDLLEGIPADFPSFIIVQSHRSCGETILHPLVSFYNCSMCGLESSFVRALKFASPAAV